MTTLELQRGLQLRMVLGQRGAVTDFHRREMHSNWRRMGSLALQMCSMLTRAVLQFFHTTLTAASENTVEQNKCWIGRTTKEGPC